MFYLSPLLISLSTGISDEIVATIVINDATRAFRSLLTINSSVRGTRAMAAKAKNCAGTFSSRHRK